jgi:hypothetical protein
MCTYGSVVGDYVICFGFQAKKRWYFYLSAGTVSPNLHSSLSGLRYPCYRPWRPLGLREVEAPKLLRQTANRWRQGCQPYAPAALYPQVSFLRFLVLISVRHWVNPTAIVWPEGVGKLWTIYYPSSKFESWNGKYCHNLHMHQNVILLYLSILLHLYLLRTQNIQSLIQLEFFSLFLFYHDMFRPHWAIIRCYC